MRTGAASAASTVGTRRHNENDITVTIAAFWRYGDWRHVATGCTALVIFDHKHYMYCWYDQFQKCQLMSHGYQAERTNEFQASTSVTCYTCILSGRVYVYGGGLLISPDGVAPSQMVSVSASVIFPCTVESRRRFLPAPVHPGRPRKGP